jgi:MFS family permease
MNGVAGIFGGLLGYAIGHITTGLQQWMYVFLIFGAISMTWAVVFTIFMPDLPTSARFLNEREKVVAVERVASNRQGVKNHHFKAYQVKQFLRDPKTWILFFMSIAAQIPNAAQSSFTSLILEGFGFTALQTQYMQIPGNVIQIVSLLLSGWISSRFPNMRCITMIVGNLIW